MSYNGWVAACITALGVAAVLGLFSQLLFAVFLGMSAVWILLIIFGRARYTDERRYPYDPDVHDRANQ